MAAEQQYRELKDDLGLDHFEGRTYPGWQHYVVLTAFAFTFLQIERGPTTADASRSALPTVRGGVREIMACSPWCTIAARSRCSRASAGVRRYEDDKAV